MFYFFQKSFDKEKKLWAENTSILYYLKSLLINVSILGFSILSLLPKHQFLIYKTYTLL